MKNIKVVQFYCVKRAKWIDYSAYECKRNWNKLSNLQKNLFISSVNELKKEGLKTRIVNRAKPL